MKYLFILTYAFKLQSFVRRVHERQSRAETHKGNYHLSLLCLIEHTTTSFITSNRDETKQQLLEMSIDIVRYCDRFLADDSHPPSSFSSCVHLEHRQEIEYLCHKYHERAGEL